MQQHLVYGGLARLQHGTRFTSLNPTTQLPIDRVKFSLHNGYESHESFAEQVAAPNHNTPVAWAIRTTDSAGNPTLTFNNPFDFRQNVKFFGNIDASEATLVGFPDSGGGPTTGITQTFADGRYARLTHTHSIAQVNGLQTALDGKANTSHTHAIGNITGLQTALDAKQATLTPELLAGVVGATAQSRVGKYLKVIAGLTIDDPNYINEEDVAVSDVVGLQADLDLKLNSSAAFTQTAADARYRRTGDIPQADITGLWQRRWMRTQDTLISSADGCHGRNNWPVAGACSEWDGTDVGAVFLPRAVISTRWLVADTLWRRIRSHRHNAASIRTAIGRAIKAFQCRGAR